MSEPLVMPTPELPAASVSESKWQREHREFLRLKPSLLASHPNQYVAIHDGRVVEAGQDQIDVALRAYAKHGYVPMYIGLVTDEPQTVRIPSPRLQA